MYIGNKNFSYGFLTGDNALYRLFILSLTYESLPNKSRVTTLFSMSPIYEIYETDDIMGLI